MARKKDEMDFLDYASGQDYSGAFNKAMNSKGKIAKTGFRIWFWLIVLSLFFSLLGFAWNLIFAPVEIAKTAAGAAMNTTKGVITQTLNADNALDKYRKFHNLYQGMEKHLANYSIYEQKAKDFQAMMGGAPYALWSSDDKSEFNFIKDTQSNFKLAYNRNAAKYNELASRMDAKFFKSLDYLPVLGLDEPLPDSVEMLR